jgi:hypothetical protein
MNDNHDNGLDLCEAPFLTSQTMNTPKAKRVRAALVMVNSALDELLTAAQDIIKDNPSPEYLGLVAKLEHVRLYFLTEFGFTFADRATAKAQFDVSEELTREQMEQSLKHALRKARELGLTILDPIGE